MAANNDAFLRSLGDIYQQLPDRAVSFDSKDCRIQCFPHVINTCVKHTIKALNSGVDADTRAGARDGKDDEESDEDEGSDDGDDGNNIVTSLEDRFPGDILNKARGLIRKIRSSGQRIERFTNVETSMAGGKMHKDLLYPFSPNNCFEMLRHGGTALIKCWFVFGNFVK
jgi:hypothetical protein